MESVCGGNGEAWLAGNGYIARVQVADRLAVPESALDGEPVGMALDPMGNPWLLERHSLLCRHIDGVEPVWKTYYSRDAARARLVAFGFSSRGATILDEAGALVEVTPRDTPWSNLA
jgi:hypothetical protein